MKQWRDYAACVEIGHEPFYPPDDREMFDWQINRAKAICDTCPVQLACLAEAARFEQRNDFAFGIWGGKTAKERRSMYEDGDRVTLTQEGVSS